MSGRGAVIVAAVLASLGAGALFFLALDGGSGGGRDGERRAGLPGRGAEEGSVRSSSGAVGGAALEAVPPEGRAPTAADLAPRTGTEPVALAPVRDLRGPSEDLARAALARSRGEPDAASLIARGRRSGSPGLVDFGRALEGRLKEHPEEATVAIDALVAEDLVDVGFQIARALADAMELDAPRARAVAAIRAAPPERQKVALLALAGRAEPEVLSLAHEVFARSETAEQAEAAATAAFLLGRAQDRAPAADLDRAAARARAHLDAGRLSGRLAEECAGVLGRAGAPEEDVARLERLLLGADDGAVRSRAIEALLASGAPASRLRAPLEAALARDGRPELEAVVRAVLGK